MLKSFKKWNGKDGWKVITPADAIAALESGARNRPLRENKAQKITAEITSGRWMENGESIVFDEKGRLIDGQHRMRACVLADKSIVAFCVFDVAGKVFPSIDQGAIRDGSDLAALMNFSNASSIASVARLAIQIADGTIAKTGMANIVSAARLTAYMDRNRTRLQAAVDHVMKQKASLRKLVAPSQVALLYYTVSENTKAADFVQKLATGEGLNKGDALLLLRARMTELIGQRHRLSHVEKLALLIKTWNAYAQDRKVGVLRWRRDVEQFPVIGQESEA